MKLIVIESPYGTNPDGTRADPETVQRNVEYAKQCMLYVINLGYAPYASHLLFTQVLNDATPAERLLGITAGFEWGNHADEVYVFEDYGISPGMRLGIERARAAKQPVTFISLKNINGNNKTILPSDFTDQT